MAYMYFCIFIVVINIMMFNLLMAVILDGFQTINKEHTGAITQDMLDKLVQAWVLYDPAATGWISLKDVVFLVCDVNEPLGKKNYFETEVKEDQKNILDQIKAKGNLVDLSQRFFVNPDRDMIIPFKNALKLLIQLQLPVYSTQFGDYRCHFRDVVKRLARNVLELKNPEYNPRGIELKHLRLIERAWNNKYPDLKINKTSWNYVPFGTLQSLENFDSGKLFSALYIVNNIEKAHRIRKYHRQEIFHQMDLTFGGRQTASRKRMQISKTRSKIFKNLKQPSPSDHKGKDVKSTTNNRDFLTDAEKYLGEYIQDVILNP